MSCASSVGGVRHALRAPILCSFVPYRVPYGVGLGLQEHLVARRARARAELRAAGVAVHGEEPVPSMLAEARRVASTDILLLLEHTPVYTLGKRIDVAVRGATASGIKADVFQTQRGGLLTYHGPGQLVGYPILDLGAMNDSIRAALDASPISVPTQAAPNDDAQHTGVWVDTTHKIASLGVHVRHRVTSHGFALNILDTALQGFRNIVACGLPDVHLTSVEEQLHKQGREMELTVPQVGGRVAAQLAHVLNRSIELAPPSLLTYLPREQNGEQLLNRVLVDGIEAPVVSSA